MDTSKMKQLFESCDMSIKLQDASVVYCSESYTDFTISKARYFAKKVSDLDAWIENQTSRPDPFDDEPSKVKILFYGSSKEANKVCRELKGDAALIMKTKRNDGHSALTSRRGSSDRNLRPKIVTEMNPTRGESISMIRALETRIESLEVKMSEIVRSIEDVSDKYDILKDQKDEDNEIEIIGTKSNHRIAEIASSIIEKKRLSKKFINQVKKWTHKDLSNDQIKQIRSALLSGSTLASKVAIKLGTIIFGEEMLRKALLGVNGEFTRKPRQFERKEIIPREKEQILRDVLSLYDESVFTDGQGWNQIVRGPINQKGREIQIDTNGIKRKDKSPSPKSRKRSRKSSDDEDTRSLGGDNVFNTSNVESPFSQPIQDKHDNSSEHDDSSQHDDSSEHED